MKKHIKILAILSIVIAVFGVSFFVADNVSAQTNKQIIQQLQEQIKQLKAQIANLQAQLGIVSPSKPEPVPIPTPKPVPSKCPVFSHKLYRGVNDVSTGGEVTKLQKMLAEDSSVYPEGLVTGYYGPLTERAVQRWQAKHGVVSSGSPATTGYGVVGPQTIAKISVVCPTTIPEPIPIPISTDNLTVLSPNGGEQWAIGSTQLIQWASGRSDIAKIAYVDIDLLSWSVPCKKGEPCPLSSAPTFGTVLARKVSNSGSFSWTVGKNISGSTIPTGPYVIRISNSENSNQYDQSDYAFNIVKEQIIIKKVGEREGSFLIQKINIDSVDGLWYQEYPVPLDVGSQKTIRIGDDIGYACEGVSEKLTNIDFSGQTVTFTKVVSNPPLGGCPICLAYDTLIDTPAGLVSVQDMYVGMPVWTMDRNGQRVAGAVIKTSKVHVPATHQVVHLLLDDGRELFVSPGHPTIDGRTTGDLTSGNLYDGARVLSAEWVAYDGTETYDILPSGETGFYWANGILLGSTLR